MGADFVQQRRPVGDGVFPLGALAHVGQRGDAVWRAQRRLVEPVGRAQHHMRLAGQGALDDIGLQAVDNGGDVDNHADADGHPAQNQRGLKPPFAQ